MAGLAAHSRAGEVTEGDSPDQEEVGSQEFEEHISEPAVGAREEEPPAPSKSLETAYLLAVGGTALPVALGLVLYNSGDNEAAIAAGDVLALSGVLVGPSLGQFHARSPWTGLGGVLFRTAAAGMVSVGFSSFMDGALCGMAQDIVGAAPDCEEAGQYAYLLPLGAVVYLGGLVYSVADTHRAVRLAPLRPSRENLRWSPTLKPDGKGGLQPGAMAVLGF